MIERKREREREIKYERKKEREIKYDRKKVRQRERMIEKRGKEREKDII
jgi:hypothetical protein